MQLQLFIVIVKFVGVLI